MSDKPSASDMFAMIRSLRDGYRSPAGPGRAHPNECRVLLSSQMDWLLINYGHLDPETHCQNCYGKDPKCQCWNDE